jgi:hypothetical protein
MVTHWLRNTARQFLDSLPLEDRYVWALRALPGMELGVRMFQERVVDFNRTIPVPNQPR